MFSCFGGSAPCPKLAPPKGHFWRYLRCFMHIEHSSKDEPFFCLRGRVGGTWRLLLGLKLRQRRMPCGSICPASDALCIAGFKTGWRLWPPTRAISPGRGSRLSKPIDRTHIAQPCLWRPRNHENYTLGFLFF